MDKEEVVIDPVCGMRKLVSQMKFSSFYNGKIYYFCSLGDKEMFDAHPDKWVKKEEETKND